ncbi:thioredoxin-like protein YneN [Paenibacillus sp. J31TS4]|uniref:redoxin domain-containing protein n=1 Tax=Paenibacillus sp. J31TS4 TaxID=2807195 RepID=UPI001B0D3126|nr:redoxin domain-containing protein [Paenibacillus sp. J31TS4]GIP37511.1 thioredoxin-like protein YneN [Paenibacillus sp. J31TS4]
MGRNRKWIQICILLAVVILGGWTIASSVLDKTEIPKVGSKAPEFTLTGLDGKTHQLSDYKGKTVVVNFWATYCPPCREEMPDIQKQAAKWADKDVVVLGVNVAESKVTAKNFVDQLGVTFPILLDSKDKIRREYGVLNYPTTVFVKPDGKIAVIKEGLMDEAYLDRTIASVAAAGNGNK